MCGGQNQSRGDQRAGAEAAIGDVDPADRDPWPFGRIEHGAIIGPVYAWKIGSLPAGRGKRQDAGTRNGEDTGDSATGAAKPRHPAISRWGDAPGLRRPRRRSGRKRLVRGTHVSVRVDLGGCRILTKKKKPKN